MLQGELLPPTLERRVNTETRSLRGTEDAAAASHGYVMPDFHQEMTAPTKRQSSQPEETKQASDPDSDMAQVLELTDREFKIIMIYTLRVLVQEQVGNASRERETP